LRFIFFITFSLSSYIAFGQQPNIEKSVYFKHFENLMGNEYTRILFQKSTLNTDSVLKHALSPKPFQQTIGDSLLKSIEKSIPLNYKLEVNEFIKLYDKSVNQHFLNYLINYYQPTIKNELIKQNLPEELSFLPAVLSGYNPNSTNTVGGEGYWHLNYPQAIKYGLVITEYVDERRDLKKSTQAATNYLKQLNSKYNNWELTLAAYVSGANTINNLIYRKQTTDFWEIYPFLNPKTRDIVPAFSALIYSYSVNNSNMISLNPIIEADTFLVENKLSFKAILDVININKKELQFLNPVIINEVFPANYLAIVPKNTACKINQFCDSIYFYQDSLLNKPILDTTVEEKEEIETVSNSNEETIHKVKSGDFLGKIAEKYGVKVSQIQEWNKLRGTNINIGQQLVIYTKSNSKEPNNSNSSSASESNSKTDFILYTVKSGDNLWDIAKNYPGVSAEDIMELNNIDENIKIGQVLKIKKK
jgi:membrane-bound lytic murein transglycosylase D